MSVPSEALTQIKCNACNKYLSYFPIFINQNTADNMPICGRCSDLLIQNGEYIRDLTYESLAEFLRFPCCFKSEGCVENFLPAEIPEHEKYCPHRIISCSLDCVWQGTVNELQDHFEELHPAAILRNGDFEMDIRNSYETFSLIIHNDELFSFRRKFDKEENTLQCFLFCYKMLDSVSKYKYEITVQNGGRNLSHKFPSKSADNFLDVNMTEIDIDIIKKKLEDPSIIIGHVKIFTDEDEVVPAPKKENPEINKEMLSELECPVCFDYIIPPIYQCITGHSICGDCKGKVTECPTCKGDIKNTQNFTLEKMAYLLTYPCRFSEYGCDFASKPGKIKSHQKFCLFGLQECPLKDYANCVFKSAAKDIYAHVFNVHHDNILEIDVLSEFITDDYFDREDDICYIKKYANSLFKLHYRYVNNCFYWSVQLIGPPEEAKTYKFEIDIQDNTNNNKKMFLRNFCAPLTNKDSVFAEEGQYVFIKLEQIRSFITDQLTYTIRLVK